MTAPVSNWLSIQRALESIVDSVLVACSSSGNLPDSCITEWREHLRAQSGPLIEAIGTEVYLRKGAHKDHPVSISVRSNGVWRNPTRKTDSTIAIALQVETRDPEDVKSGLTLMPHPIRLFSKRTSWNETVSALATDTLREGMPGRLVLKLKGVLSATVPTVMTDPPVPKHHVLDCRFAIIANSAIRKRGLTDECIGVLKVAGKAAIMDGTTRDICPTTMFFDTDSMTTYEVTWDLFPALTPPGATPAPHASAPSPAVKNSRGSRAPLLSIAQERAIREVTRWEEAVGQFEESLKQHGMSGDIIRKVSDAVIAHPPTVRTAFADELITDWQFRIAAECATYEHHGRDDCLGSLAITGETDTVLGMTMPFKRVTMHFDTGSGTVKEGATAGYPSPASAAVQ